MFRHAVNIDVRSVDAWLGLAATQTGARHAMCLRWAVYVDSLPRPVAARFVPTSTFTARSRWSRAVVVGVANVGIMLICLLGVDVADRDRVLPGVVVANIEVGNKPGTDLEARLQQREQRLAERSAEIRIDGQIWRVLIHTVLQSQAAVLAQAAYAYGHDPSLWQRARAYGRVLTGHQQRVGVPQPNVTAVRTLVAQLAQQIDQPPYDAHLERTDQGWIIKPKHAGRALDQRHAADLLIQALGHAAWNEQRDPIVVALVVVPERPTRTVAQLEPVREQLQQLSNTPLVLEHGQQRWQMDRSTLIDISPQAGLATMEPSDTLIRQQLETIAPALAVAPQPSQLVWQGDRVQTIVLGRAGTELDRDPAVQQIKEALATGAAQIVLPTRAVPPPSGEAEQLALVAELGRGESQFVSYSSPARDTNVHVGGNDVNGLLVAPGNVFSFTQTVGSITEGKGYQRGEAIESGLVVPSLGGGICQVSTTIFRAAFWSGLEIVERYNHSWRLP